MQNKTIKLELSIEETNLILAGLGKLPAEASMGLILEIQKQANEQLKEEKKTE